MNKLHRKQENMHTDRLISRQTDRQKQIDRQTNKTLQVRNRNRKRKINLIKEEMSGKPLAMRMGLIQFHWMDLEATQHYRSKSETGFGGGGGAGLQGGWGLGTVQQGWEYFGVRVCQLWQGVTSQSGHCNRCP